MSYLSLLNNTCTINRITQTQNATSNQFVKTASLLAAGVACRLDGAGGGEQRQDNDTFSKRTHILFLEYRTDVDWKNAQVVVGSQTFNVLLVANAGGQFHHTEIDLEIVE